MITLNPLKQDLSTFLEIFSQLTGKSQEIGLHLYRHIMQKGNLHLNELFVLTQSRHIYEQVQNTFEFLHLEPTHQRDPLHQGAQKLFFKTRDGFTIESVLIPMNTYWTVCISSQIGCRQACTFCETAKMGLIRNLSTDEIIYQVFYAKHVLKYDVRNIVFMGMGEPLDNFEAVIKSTGILTNPHGLGIGSRRITLSTSGDVAAIEKLIALPERSFQLAVSLNAASDEKRQKIMPINKKYPLSRLQEALSKYPLKRAEFIFIEYIMFKDFNDSPEDAQMVAEFCRSFNARINLIPFNPGTRPQFEPSTPEAIASFKKILVSHHFQVTERTTKGDKIMAACGQLGDPSVRLNRFSKNIQKPDMLVP